MKNDNLSIFIQNNIVYILLALLVLYFIFYYNENSKTPPHATITKSKQCMHKNKIGNCDRWVVI